ncbi:MAG TPA: hypothetical protein PLX89_01060 [Verrucomicrobiota bacterium]|nr:hypothetical protein [Verrucomicrobiales bacterium]HRI11565.1 hypothetical protein [Verrucomicrobiota bacterium]
MQCSRGRPTALRTLRHPVILSGGPGFGATTNGFGFLISWAPGASVVVEASPDLAAPVWTPVSTNTLTAGTESGQAGGSARSPTRSG